MFSSICQRIQGFADAAGDATAGYPVLVAGSTNTDVIRRLRVTDDGRLETFIVSSSGGTPSVMGDISHGSAPGASKPFHVAGISSGGNIRRLIASADDALLCAVTSTATPTDGMANSESAGGYGPNGAGRAFTATTLRHNGTTWDRNRNNIDATAFASAARTATPTAATFTIYNGAYLSVVIDVTAIAATPSVVFNIEAQDAVSGQWITLLASAAIVATGTTTLRIGPSLTAAANLVANDFVRRNMRIRPVHANADSITYSVGYQVTCAA